MQGLAALVALNILQQLQQSMPADPLSADSLHRRIEAMRYGIVRCL